MSHLPPPHWALRVCPGCGRDVALLKHDLTCPGHDPRTRVAVAWICGDCDQVLGLVGLFTSWPEAFSAHNRELDEHGPRYITTERCRCGIK